MRRKLILIVSLFFFITNVRALSYAGCDFSDVARMKQIVSNINVSYNYRIVNDEAYFDVIINNLTNDIYVTDNYYKGEFHNFINGELVLYNVKANSIYLKFNSNRLECRGLLLGNKYEQFPIFNKYYDDEVCSGIKGLSYCNKWVNKEYTFEEVKSAVEKHNSITPKTEEPTQVIYKKTLLDKVIAFYLKYYYIVLAAVIVFCVTIIIINKRKNQFKI